MSSGEFLGKNVEEQLITLGVLKESGPLSYEQLQSELDLSDQEMQKVMRGIRFNGLVNEKTDEVGVRIYEPDW